MPVSPAMAEDLAAAVRRLYEEAERSLIERMARALAEGIGSPLWAEIKLRSVGDLREAVERITAALQQDADGAVALALAEAYGRGRQAAVAELGGLDVGRELQARRLLPGAPAVDRLAASWAADSRPLYRRITRAVLDSFRDIITRVTAGPLLGTETRRQASQRALNQFAERGIRGFTDKSGRRWELATYAEMAVRSVTARAAVEGHTDTLEEAGVGLVVVSDAPLECPLCAPWEGEVLALSGQPGPRTVQAPHATDTGSLLRRRPTVSVHVVGTLPEARAAGLFHPNCRHSVSAYLPGVTERPQAPPHPSGATYKDTQKQRYLERQVRAWKRRAAAALDEDARRTANARVRAYQARIRQLTADTGLKRKPTREQSRTAR
ncbi:phage minor capsid protein [Streptomyces diacarni]|uniref:phage minor capsid protein n=1 Tax=Streptomyces diacarni TaxID=2800381 RepID=UPI003405DB58